MTLNPTERIEGGGVDEVIPTENWLVAGLGNPAFNYTVRLHKLGTRKMRELKGICADCAKRKPLNGTTRCLPCGAANSNQTMLKRRAKRETASAPIER